MMRWLARPIAQAAGVSQRPFARVLRREFSTDRWQITVGGNKMDPTDLEAIIEQHPNVAEAAVIPIDGSESNSEIVKALVVLEEGALQWTKASRRANMSAGEKVEKLTFDGEIEKLLTEADIDVSPHIEIVRNLPRVDGEIQRDDLKQTIVNRRPDFISIDDPSRSFDRRR